MAPIRTKEPKPKRKSENAKLWRGTIRFDSETEAKIYDQLLEENPAVIAHGKIALGNDAHIEPDFFVVTEIHDDGSVTGKFQDAKARWKGKKQPHVEKDWDAKRKWLWDKFRISIDILFR